MRSGGVSRPPAVSDDEDADWGQASNRPPSYWQDSEDVEVELLDNSEDTKRPNGKSTYIFYAKNGERSIFLHVFWVSIKLL